MEAFSVAPSAFSLLASLSACAVFVYNLTHQNPRSIDHIGDAIIFVKLAILSLIFFAFANIFAIVAFFQLNYPDSPKGLVSKILYRTAAGFLAVWVVLALSIFYY